MRSREFAIRVAVGAAPTAVRDLVFRGALRMLAIGIAAGLVVTLAATRALQSLLYLVSPTDPAALAIAVMVLVVAALLASFVPANAARRLSVTSLLREE
jgi:ABC-type antimicrobial peptide transport system permease subunit